MKRPWLSVLVPTYNGSKYLSAALESVAAEREPDIELIASDDGSTDDTLSILREHAGRNAVTILEHDAPGNWAENTNRALARAAGEYACVLHQDDLWLPGRVRAVRDLTEKSPAAILLLSPSRFVDAAGKTVGEWRCPLPAYPAAIAPDLLTARLLVQNFVPPPAPVFRRDAALDAGGFDPSLWYTPDWNLWLELARTGPAVYSAEPGTAFRVHDESQSVVRSRNHDAFERELTVVLERHWERWQAPPRLKKKTLDAARFSIRANVALAGRMHGKGLDRLGLLGSFVALGPGGAWRYWRDSRIWERARARLRAGMGPPS